MKVAVNTEHRFLRAPDGAVWTEGLQAHSYWSRYLSVFDGVKVLARLIDVPSVGASARRADGPGVTFAAIPNYRGSWRYLTVAGRVHEALRASVESGDAAILSASSQLAGCVESILARRGQPYGVEVVNDPFDVFAPGAVRCSLRPLFRWKFARQLRRQCRRAAGAVYVTQSALQTRYPCPAGMTGISNVEITGDALASQARTFGQAAQFRLVTVASLAQMYKAPDVLIRAVAECIHRGMNLTLRLVGDGKYRPELERLSASLGMEGRICFAGQLTCEEVRRELDGSDLFVLPSWCEGLPRAMVEAMARALPCVGSTAGGIPELLAAEDLVGPGDVESLAAKISEVLSDPLRMQAMSDRNLSRARDYRLELLTERRNRFYRQIHRATAAWQAGAYPGLTFRSAGC